MVFYHLTPAQIDRYSRASLCPALSSPGRIRAIERGGGIYLVNRPTIAGAAPVNGGKLHLTCNFARTHVFSTSPHDFHPASPGMEVFISVRRSARCSN